MSGPGAGVPIESNGVGEQIPLSLSLPERATFDTFFGLSDRPHLGVLEEIGRGGGPHLLYLWGAEGAGKSHLLHATSNALDRTDPGGAIVLSLATLRWQGVEVIEGIERYSLVALDDLDAIAGDKGWEEALFHLLNRMRDLGHRVVVSGSAPLSVVAIQLPDLRSRLGEGVVEHLAPLEDREKWQVLRQRAEARGMVISDEVATFLMNRTARDFHALIALLDRLDRQTLVAQRRLTIPFVKELLSL